MNPLTQLQHPSLNAQQLATLDRTVAKAVAEHNEVELALGWVRYEALRRVTVRQFAQMADLCLKGRSFDGQVDELVARGGES